MRARHSGIIDLTRFDFRKSLISKPLITPLVIKSLIRKLQMWLGLRIVIMFTLSINSVT